MDAELDPLVEITAVVPWQGFRHAPRRVWRKRDANCNILVEREHVDTALIFKTLVPCALCNHSDEQAEYQVRGRRLFMRSVGRGLGYRVADTKTV